MHTTEIFDGISWSAGPDLPGGRDGHGMVSYQYSKVFLIAGVNIRGHGPTGFSTSCFEYDFNTPDQQWVQKQDIPHATILPTSAHLR